MWIKNKNEWALIIALVFVASPIVSGSVFADDKKDDDDFFILPESTLEAAERKLASETDPYKKFQILLRWVRIKEEVEKNQIARGVNPKSEEFLESKREIIKRLETSLYEFARYDDIDIVVLFRELGFRYSELRKHDKALEYFQRIPSPTPEDYLSIGDSYFNTDQLELALKAFDEAGKSDKLRGAAAYKKAWTYMRKNDFPNALKEFNACLTDTYQGNARLKAEAFQDRIRPYLENFQKKEFGREDNRSLENLALLVYSDDAEKRQDIYAKALQSLVVGFNAKSRVRLAQNVFFFLSKAIDDTTEILITSAPVWIKVYRGRLEHEQVARILKSLPNRPIDIERSNPLRAEIYNTAVFYESYKEEESEREEAWRLLRTTYQKYFELYPLDKDADPLRVNYGRILLTDAKAKRCIEILENRGGEDEAVEKIAKSLAGKCELKYLDELYSSKQDDFFFGRLGEALLVKKIYLIPDLGVTAEQAFDSVTRMLIGSLEKHSNNEKLRDTLKKLLKGYPYEKESQLYYDLQTVSAELRFKDLLASNLKPEEKAPGFFEIYQEARKGTQVAEKALTNSVIMGRDEESLERCDLYRDTYGKKFIPEEPVFDKCIQLAEHFLKLEQEYSFWMFNEKRLSKAQLLRVGLLEMAQKKPAGRSRIESLRTEEALKALELWDGASAKSYNIDPNWHAAEKSSKRFLASLTPIKLSQIGKLVPQKIKAFESADERLIKYYNSGPEGIWAAHALEMRSRISLAFADWMKNLPAPSDLTEEEQKLYSEKAAEVVKPWEDRALEAKKACSEIAYTLSKDFKETDKDACPEDTKGAEFRRLNAEWRQSIPRNARVSQIVRVILNRASQTEETSRAKYYLLRALELSENDRERANAFLVLARKVDKDRYWLAASELDGSLSEPIQWKKKQAEGNPFYERLYESQLRQLRGQGQR